MTQHPKELPIIEFEQLRETQADLGDKFKIVVQYFFEDTDTYISNINSAIRHNAIEKIIPPAHTIKSASKIISATKVSELATQLEVLAQSPTPKLHDITSCFDQLKIELAAAKQEFIKLGLL